MFGISVRDLFKRRLRRVRKPAPRRSFFRPQLFAFEDRIVPADITWVGTGTGDGAKWSVIGNWNPRQLPTSTDTVILDGTVGANTDSTMDLGGAGTFHIGKLLTKNGYTKTLTLNAPLFVDVLDMETNATISAATKYLAITQRTTDPVIPKATIFGTSFWTDGTIQVSTLAIYAENAHRATFQIGDTRAVDNTVLLKSDLTLQDGYVTVNWVAGDVTVDAGKTVTNYGTFFADSPRKSMGNDLGAGKEWNFTNGNVLNMGKGKFSNVKERTMRGARVGKVASLSTGTDTFEVAGTFTLEDATASTSVQSGTLLVTGTYTQTDGDTSVSAGTTLSVTGTYTLSGGTASTTAGPSTAVTVGSFQESGGTFTLAQGTTLSATGAVTLSGDGFVLAGGTLTATSGGVQVQSGGTLDAWGTITGNLTNAGILNIGGAYSPGSMQIPIGTLTVTGNYTQTGTLNMEIGGQSSYDRLQVSGLATLGGTLNVTLLYGFMPTPGQSFSVLTYGSRSGTFGVVNLPTLTSGYWSPQYDNPAGTFTLWVVQ